MLVNSLGEQSRLKQPKEWAKRATRSKEYCASVMKTFQGLKKGVKSPVLVKLRLKSRWSTRYESKVGWRNPRNELSKPWEWGVPRKCFEDNLGPKKKNRGKPKQASQRTGCGRAAILPRVQSIVMLLLGNESERWTLCRDFEMGVGLYFASIIFWGES